MAGGADLARRCLRTGLLDEVRLHLVPVILGGGVRLFEGLRPEEVRLEPIGVRGSPAVTHLAYRVLG